MDIAFRSAQLNDLELGSRILQAAILDLRQRHAVNLPQPLPPPEFARLCLGEDSSGLWVAEAGGEVVGWAMSWMCGRFWFLSQLFVRPDLQAMGLGQNLLQRTFAQAERRGAENRALITFAYNMHSTGLYIRNGMYPRTPLYFMATKSSTLPADFSRSGHLAEDIGPVAEALEWLGEIDEAVLGFRRDAHHAFLLGGGGPRGLRITCAGRTAGYAYASPNGFIGPLAVLPGEDPAAVVGAALRCVLKTARPQQVTMFIPGPAEQMMGFASELGFRIQESLVLLSAKPFGNWRNYAPSNPGYM